MKNFSLWKKQKNHKVSGLPQIFFTYFTSVIPFLQPILRITKMTGETPEVRSDKRKNEMKVEKERKEKKERNR